MNRRRAKAVAAEAVAAAKASAEVQPTPAPACVDTSKHVYTRRHRLPEARCVDSAACSSKSCPAHVSSCFFKEFSLATRFEACCCCSGLCGQQPRSTVSFQDFNEWPRIKINCHFFDRQFLDATRWHEEVRRHRAVWPARATGTKISTSGYECGWLRRQPQL